ncbi:hypothetical protein Krac_5510 [Ktedonobacter racemifer DSM 44963]|uniref:Uncharacterized protein n=1 Tax=Ktedonobacter racemifer DSM 44963 TaxID=485913 RepID=D6TW79_KTERA|nr:hypothetical protein Krac_5510 [Ktedonobacter racemifer DSM 44963]
MGLLLIFCPALIFNFDFRATGKCPKTFAIVALNRTRLPRIKHIGIQFPRKAASHQEHLHAIV